MKCPLLQRYYIQGNEKGSDTIAQCLQAECAWWDDTLKRCSIQIIAQFMVGIGVHIHNIAENMPFKGQL